MRYSRAVERLRLLAEACQVTTMRSADEPLLRAAYVFGDILTGADPVETVEVACVLDLPPDDVPWGAHPPGTAWLVDALRLDRGGFAYWWRSGHEPVWNHHIREPVRFWSLNVTADAVLDALRDRRFADLPRVSVSPTELRHRTQVELDRALRRLRAVHAAYWDRGWRREHRGGGRYPENDLWEAVDGYLDLLGMAGRAGGDLSG